MEKQFEISVISQDDKLCVAKFDELKTSLMVDMEDYKTIVVNVDNKTDSKKVLATLRKKRKEIEDKRIALKKEYDEPFNFFAGQVKELVAIIDEPIKLIDEQVKVIENALDLELLNQKAKRLEAVKAIYGSIGISWIKFEEVYNDKMDTLKLEEIKEALEEVIEAKKTVLENLDEDSAILYMMNGFDYEKAASSFGEFAKAKKRYKTFQSESEIPF